MSNELASRALPAAAENGRPLERWEMLYGLTTKQEQDMKRLKEQYAEADAKKQQCTFQPQLVSEAETTPPADGSVQERAMKWEKKREEKLRAMQESSEDRELADCTFQPYLMATSNAHMARIEREEPPQDNQSNASGADAFISSMKSVEQYIEKQKALREQKEQDKKMAEQYAGSGMRRGCENR